MLSLCSDTGFRLQQPQRSLDGTFVVNGWFARDYLAGAHRLADRDEVGQCLLRAMIFRHVTSLLLPGRLPRGAGADRYASLRRAVVALVADRV